MLQNQNPGACFFQIVQTQNVITFTPPSRAEISRLVRLALSGVDTFTHRANLERDVPEAPVAHILILARLPLIAKADSHVKRRAQVVLSDILRKPVGTSNVVAIKDVVPFHTLDRVSLVLNAEFRAVSWPTLQLKTVRWWIPTLS